MGLYLRKHITGIKSDCQFWFEAYVILGLWFKQKAMYMKSEKTVLHWFLVCLFIGNHIYDSRRVLETEMEATVVV